MRHLADPQRPDPLLPVRNSLRVTADTDRGDHREESGGRGRALAARRRAAVRGRDPGGGEASPVRHRLDARGGA